MAKVITIAWSKLMGFIIVYMHHDCNHNDLLLGNLFSQFQFSDPAMQQCAIL